MAEISWVKLTTDMFDNRKIKHLRKLPDGNAVVLIWVMLLTMAGRCNAGGMIFLTENIPYTTKTLADELGFDESMIQMALDAMTRLDMIITNGDYFAIAGWEEYQNIDGMEHIREQNRIRQKRWYDKQKCIANVRNNVTITQPNATDKDIDKDIDKDKDKESLSKDNDNKTAKAVKHKYGEYDNVLLTDEERDKLIAEYSDWRERVERLSSYIASKGAKYKSHYATIRNWARNEHPGNQGTNNTSSTDKVSQLCNRAVAWAMAEEVTDE